MMRIFVKRTHLTSALTTVLAAVCLISSHSGNLAAAQTPTDAHGKFFENKIRPLLLASCMGCHGKDNPGGGLRLDIPVSLPNALEIVKRVKGEGKSARMPLGSTLTQDKIEAIETWVKAGSYWPSGSSVSPTADFARRAKNHWAFQPVRKVAPPHVRDPHYSSWSRNPIDAFILDPLLKRGLKPSPVAGRRELIRRLTFDLTGLPPTPEEVIAFEADRSSGAYDALVDRLLASPHYGEKWGRHWLDVVRYAETNSYERDNPKPNVYRYRDWVISAFNQDKPYDQFVREQIAGDEIAKGAGDAVTGTGYYRLGIWDDEPADIKQAEYDDLDDLVVTTGQALLGLTLDCARCHDHKFDPIPQRDYYRMVAFFKNINRFKNGGPTDESIFFASADEKAAYTEKLADLDAKRKAAANELKQVEDAYNKGRDSLIKPSDFVGLRYRYFEGAFGSMPDFEKLKPIKSGTLMPAIIDLKTRRRDENFGYVFEGELKAPQAGNYTFYIDTDDGSKLTIAGNKLTEKAGGGQGAEMTATLHLAAGQVPFRIDYFQSVGPFGLNFAWSGPGFERRPLSALSACSSLGLPTLQKAELAQIVGRDRAELYNKIAQRKAELDKQEVASPRVLCVTETGPNATDTFVLKRGNPNAPDEKVQPGFPTCLGGGDAVVPAPPAGATSSGRRTALANWLTSPSNPLVARVIVNRVWQGHFGRGIVRTPNDFGMQGSKPTHPALLDWLSARFVQDGWSLKKLNKLILTSNAYKQSSRSAPIGLAKDPGNDLFWRFDMRRLEAEEIRDSILAASGNLNLKLYGESVYPEIPKDILAAQSIPGNDWYTQRMKPEDVNRRSIYIHVKRSLIYPLLATFDLPDTDRTSALRFASTQPTQALGLVNGSFANQQAAAMAARVSKDIGASGTDRAFVMRAFSLTMQRRPTEAETTEGAALLKRLEQRGATHEKALQYLCLAALNLDEFVYLD